MRPALAIMMCLCTSLSAHAATPATSDWERKAATAVVEGNWTRVAEAAVGWHGSAPADVIPCWLLTWANLAKGDERAADEYRRLLPENPEAWKGPLQWASSLAAKTPDSAPAHLLVGDALMKALQFREALAAFDEAVRCDPGFAWSYFARGLDHAVLSEQDAAFRDLNRAVDLSPETPWAYRARGMLYSRRGDADHAIADYGRVIELAPSDSDAYMDRGAAYAAKGRLDLAIADYTKVIELDPSSVAAYSRRAEAYERLGQTEQSAADRTAAAALMNAESAPRAATDGAAASAVAAPAGLGLGEETLSQERSFTWTALGIATRDADITLEVRSMVTDYTVDRDPVKRLATEVAKEGGLFTQMIAAGILSGGSPPGLKDAFVLVSSDDADYLRFPAIEGAPRTIAPELREYVRLERVRPLRDSYGLPDSARLALVYVFIRPRPTGRLTPEVSLSLIDIGSSSAQQTVAQVTGPHSLAFRGTIRFDPQRWVPFFGGLYCKGGGAVLDDSGMRLLLGTSVRYPSPAAKAPG